MAYTAPYTVEIDFPLVDFGDAANSATSFKGPSGMKGEIIDIGVRATEVFACDTTTAKVRVGSATDADAYAELNIADGTAATDTFNATNDTDAIIEATLPADTQIEVAFIDGTDASAVTGQGYPYIIVAWY